MGAGASASDAAKAIGDASVEDISKALEGMSQADLDRIRAAMPAAKGGPIDTSGLTKVATDDAGLSELPIRVLTCQCDGAAALSVAENISRWRSKLSTGALSDKAASDLAIDIVHFPETAFSRYFYSSKDDIAKYGGLEECGKGPVFEFAKEITLKFKAYVVVGYAETAGEVNYNSMYVVSREGELLKNHRKLDLFVPDNTWCVPDGSPANTDSQKVYSTLQMKNTKGQDFKAGLILCQEIIGPFGAKIGPEGPRAIAHQFHKDNVNVVLFSCCWPASANKDLDLAPIWEKQMAPMSYTDENCSSKSWVFCVADGCGEEQNVLTPEQWGEVLSEVPSFQQPTLAKRGVSGVKRYEKVESAPDPGAEVDLVEGKMATVIAQCDDANTEPVLPTDVEDWKVFEAVIVV